MPATWIHPDAAEQKRLRVEMYFSLAMAPVWFTLAAGPWAFVWRLWSEAILLRMPSVILLFLANAAVVWAIVGYEQRHFTRWTVIGVALHVAAYVTAVSRGAPLHRTFGWHGGLSVLLMWVAFCVAKGCAALGALWKGMKDYRDAGRRLAHDADATERPGRVVDALEATRKQWRDSIGNPPLARLTFFGDPIRAPDRVIVWGLYERAAGQAWTAPGLGSADPVWPLARDVNASLRDAGYPFEVDVGVASAEEAEAAGGDFAWFGEDGRRRTPQSPARRA